MNGTGRRKRGELNMAADATFRCRGLTAREQFAPLVRQPGIFARLWAWLLEDV